MATNDTTRDDEFEAAFNDNNTGAAGAGEFEAAFNDDSAGLNLDSQSAPGADAAETAAPAESAPAAVVVVAEADGAASSEAAANEAAAAEAKAVTDENNEAAKTNKQPAKTSGEAQAAAQSGKDAKPAAAAAVEEDEPAAAAPVAAAGEADPFDLSDVPPEEMQRAKSWVGRLKKMEADLKARSAPAAATPATAAPAGEEGGDQAAGDAIEQAAQQAAAEGDPEKAQTVADVADQVKSGELSPQEAMQILASDFGDEFVQMISVVARHAAAGATDPSLKQRLDSLEQNTQGVIDHLKTAADRKHYQAIYDAHPDFMEVHSEPGFGEFVASQGAQAVVEKGSAQEINKLLAAYKESKPAAAAPAGAQDPASPAQDAVAAAQKAAPVDQNAVDAAEGVRSAGLRLPEKPGKSNDDFASAWNDF